MIAPIEAENTIRCKVIANPPFKANNLVTPGLEEPSGVTMRKLS
jgi:hypothetical protein